jgi:hypothetical protein
MARNYEDEYNESLQPGDLGTSSPATAPAAAPPATSSAPESWQGGYDTLLKQMGAVQSQQDIYKRRSPLSADRHIQNIAKSLAKDYGITNISDIKITETKPGYAVYESDQGGGSQTERWVDDPSAKNYVYTNKYTGQEIPGTKFASEGEGDGYSDYSLQPVPDGKGGMIALPVQQYSKSGMGAAVEAIQPIMPAINLALMAAGVPPLYMAAGNVGFQAAGGNVKDVGDALRIAAPYLVSAGLQELPELTEALRAGPAVEGYNRLTDAGQIASNLTGLSGAAANTLGGAAAGGIGSLLAGKDVGQGLLTGGLGGAAASAGQKIFDAATAAGYSKDAANAMSRAATSVIRGLPSGNLEQIIANSGLSAAGSYLSSAIAAETGSKFAGNVAALALQSAAGFDPNPSAYITLLQQGRNELIGKRDATAGTNTTAATTDPAAATVNTALAGAQDPLAQLQAGDLGTGQRLDTVNVAGTTPAAGNEQDLTLSNLSGRSGAADTSTLTSSQLAALTSTQLASVLVSGQSQVLDANAVADLTSGNLGTKAVSSAPTSTLTSSQLAALTSAQLPSVLVTAQKPALDVNTLTDTVTPRTLTNTSKPGNTLNSSQIAALSTSPIALASNQLPTVTVTAQRPGVDPNVITDIITSVTKPTTQLTSIVPALTSGPAVITTTQLTSIVPALTSGPAVLPTSQVTSIVPALTSGLSTLTSSQISALTTLSPMGLQALPTSDAGYYRQTGAKGTGGKGGVRFFDWYDTPENRTMAPPSMASVNIPAITSQQAEAMVNPAKRYFNQSTNRYYTDPTGQWTPPAGWAQTTFYGGGEVDDFDTLGLGLPTDISTGYGNDLGGYNFADADLGIGPVGGYGDSAGYDWAYGDEAAREEDINSYLRGLPSENASYGGGKDQTARYQQEIKDAAVTGSSTKPLSGASNVFKQLADAAKNNPKLTAALAAAGLGGLLGYMGRPKGITPMGMQGLGLSQGQVYGALKGKPVQRAEGGEIDGYAKGGGLHYLKSAEDGMADRIPATIDNKQPAKLSGGEFVIPADVVSHLGNGNSEAGAKQLYAMMDRIRHARTGTKKQGKQINPAKFTPK